MEEKIKAVGEQILKLLQENNLEMNIVHNIQITPKKDNIVLEKKEVKE